eukprot:6500125-Pyramimonas_sp.AAC.1
MYRLVMYSIEWDIAPLPRASSSPEGWSYMYISGFDFTRTELARKGFGRAVAYDGETCGAIG